MELGLGPGEVFGLLIATIGVSIYFFLKGRHAERMAMIEKGMLQAPSFQSGGQVRRTNFIGVKLGMLIFGSGLGMLIAYFISMATQDDTIYPVMIMLFGGGSLVVSFFVERRLAAKQNEDEIL